MLRLRNPMHMRALEDLSWKLLVKFISITFPHFATHFFHFQQIFEFLPCAGPCNMSWETRGKRQRWGLQTSCCGGSYMTPLPSWRSPKSKSGSAVMVGHTRWNQGAWVQMLAPPVGLVASFYTTILSYLEGWCWDTSDVIRMLCVRNS